MFHKYAFVKQNDQSDCGAAALATIAVHYGMPIGLQQMRELAGTDRVGTNLLGLIGAANKIGLEAKAVQGPYEALPKVPLPAIAHVRTREGLGHFVVLHRVTPTNVVIADPAHDVETLSKEEFCQRWTGYLLLVTPNPHLRPSVETATPTGPGRRFAGLLFQHTSLLFEAIFAALLMTVLGIASAFFIQHLVDSVLVRHEHKLLNALGLGMVLIVLFRVIFAALRQYLLAHMGRKIDLALIAGYARHVLGLPLSFFETRQVGDILSRVNDAAKVRSAVSGATTTAIVDGMLVLVMMVVLYCYDFRLAFVSTAFVALLLISTWIHHPFIRRRSREVMEHSAHLSSQLVEDVSAVETIKVFGAQSQRTDEAESRLVRVVQSCFQLQSLGNSMNNISMAITGIAGIAVLWYGGYRVMDGALSIGQLVFFHSLLGYLLEPLERLATINVQLQDALVAVERLGQITDLQTEPLSVTGKVQFKGIRDAIELRDIRFQYGCRSTVLESLSLTIPRGKTVAIIGASGSGKSTLLKLLTGLYAPTEGKLLFDGIDLRDHDLASVRAGIGVVTQEPFLFTGSVRDNITVGDPSATLEQVIAATKAAGLASFIDSLPLRYDTILGERGANLSGGQRQRLAIARAILRNPDLFIFDEATSHLDTATERFVHRSLRKSLANKTVVLVAHRLSTVRDADLIYVLDQGRIVEQGTHRQLLAKDCHYANLWRAQTEESDIHSASREIPTSSNSAELCACTA